MLRPYLRLLQTFLYSVLLYSYHTNFSRYRTPTKYLGHRCQLLGGPNVCNSEHKTS